MIPNSGQRIVLAEYLGTALFLIILTNFLPVFLDTLAAIVAVASAFIGGIKFHKKGGSM